MAKRLTDLTIEQLEELRPDLAAEIKAHGQAEEAARVAVEKDEKEAKEAEESTALEDKMADAREAGAKAERDRVSALHKAFPERSEFVADQAAQGATLEEAKSAFAEMRLAELKAENRKLKEERAEGTSPVESSGEREHESRHERAKDYAAEHDCTITEALKKTAPQRPRK